MQFTPPTEDPCATVGVITALPVEFAAARAALGCCHVVSSEHPGVRTTYSMARIASNAGGENIVAVALLPDMGNNIAAVVTSHLLRDHPTVTQVIMCGIAGAVPYPAKAEHHVRLGDGVISDRNGVVQYDLDKETPTRIEHRHPPRPPSAPLLQAARSLLADDLAGCRPWEALLSSLADQLGPTWQRPPERYGRLREGIDDARATRHPPDLSRRPGQPRLFLGPIASANKLLKNPVKRNQLRDRFSVKAVEMEGSGLADAAWFSGVEYLVVRGTCDYCNPDKGDRWHAYAALVAAAVTRVVIERLPPMGSASATAVSVVCNVSSLSAFSPSVSPPDGMAPSAGALLRGVMPGEHTTAFTGRADTRLVGPSRGPDEAVEPAAVAHGPVPTQAPNQILVLRQGQDQVVQLQESLDSMEHEAADEYAARLHAWLMGHERMLPASFLVPAYTLLAEAEMIKARLAEREHGRFDGARSRYFIQKARDVLNH